MENSGTAAGSGLISRCVDWIEARLKPFWSDYCGRYMRHVRSLHSHGDVFVPGPLGPHRIELNEAQIPTSVTWRQPTIAWADQNRNLPLELRKGDHSIWEFLNGAGPWAARLVVVGEPGGGKTTLLKHIAVTLANESRHDGNDRPPRLVPVLLSIPDLSNRIDANPDLTLYAAIEASLRDYTRVKPPRGLWKRDLESGYCLILLDGFGAIADPEVRGRVAAWVQQQMAAYPRSPFIVAARPHEYDANPLSGATVLSLSSADRLDSIAGTIDALLNWSETDEPGSKPVERLDPTDKRRILQTLAYETMRAGRQWISTEDASSLLPAENIRAISGRNGFLIDRGHGQLAFMYRPYQEYLAAEHISQTGAIGEISLKLGDSWWQETIKHCCQITGDAMPILQPSLTVDNLSADTIAMAYECLESAAGAPESVSERLEQYLDGEENRIDLESVDPEARRAAAEQRLALRLRRMKSIDDDRTVSRSLVTNSEYQLFLDDQRALGVFCQPDHWTALEFPAGTGNRPVGGMRPEDALAFSEWLTRREGGDHRFRTPTIAESMISGPPSNGDGFGYWSVSGENRACQPASDNTPQLTVDALRRWIIEDRVRADQLDGMSEHAGEIERAMEFPFEDALQRAQGRPIRLQLATDRENVKSLDLLLGRAYHLAQFMDHSKAVNEVKDRNRLANDRARAGELGRALPLAIERILERNPIHGRDRKRDRALARATALALATVMTDLWEHLPTGRNDEMKELAGMIDRHRVEYLDLYLSLVTLEERTEGRLAAFESLLIMTDRVEAAAVVAAEPAEAQLLAA